MRHHELFDRIESVLKALTPAKATPDEALSILQSYAFLKLGHDLDPELWKSLELQALSPGPAKLHIESAVAMCHIYFLDGPKRADDRLDAIADLCENVAGPILQKDDRFWGSSDGVALRRRLLLLRSSLRYLYRERYKALPAEVTKAFRCVHRLESNVEVKPMVNFTRKLSAILTKLKVGHMCNVDRGP